mgnify:CR=1 FL=1
MSPSDIPLWQEFLRLHGKEYTAFEYDVPVGDGIPPPEDIPDFAKKDWIALTKKRIDVVGFKANDVEIFEIKPRAGLTALGQLLGYWTLYKKTHGNSFHISLTLITSMLTPDERLNYDRYNIKTYVYNVPT